MLRVGIAGLPTHAFETIMAWLARSGGLRLKPLLKVAGLLRHDWKSRPFKSVRWQFRHNLLTCIYKSTTVYISVREGTWL